MSITDCSPRPALAPGKVHETRCKVCRSPYREDIDKLLIEEKSSLREVANEYGFSISSCERHKLKHLSQTLKIVAAENAIRGGQAAYDRVQTRAQQLHDTYESTGSIPAAKAALEHDTPILKIEGVLRDTHDLNVSGNITLSPGDKQEADMRRWLMERHPDLQADYQDWIDCQIAKELTSDAHQPA